jgi:hypothetical protein
MGLTVNRAVPGRGRTVGRARIQVCITESLKNGILGNFPNP